MIRRRGLLKGLQVTTDALIGEALTVKFPDGSGPMTGVAIHGGMSANQRKAVLMLVDRMHRYLPSVDAMADITLAAVFVAVDVDVTILALPAGVSQNRIRVAIAAWNLHVHAAQRELRVAVVEFGVAPRRLP